MTHPLAFDHNRLIVPCLRLAEFQRVHDIFHPHRVGEADRLGHAVQARAGAPLSAR